MDTKMMAPTKSAVQELVIERIFDAPKERLWKAWTDPDQMRLWWGPEEFTAPYAKIDFRVGGKYLFCMRTPEGQDLWSAGVYREIVPMERIVCTDSFADEEGNVVPASHYGIQGEFPLELLVTVTFENDRGKTIMTLQHAGIPSGMLSDCEAGWSGSFDKLAESLT